MAEPSRRKEKITAVVLFAFSILYLYGCWGLKLGTMRNPGPGFIPIVVGVLLFLCTGAQLYREWKRGRGAEKEAKAQGEGKNYLAVYGILASVVFYPFMLSNLKFIFATLIVMFAMMVLLRFKNSAYSFLVAISITLVSFVVFARLLGVALPSGILEELIYMIGG